MQKNLTVIGTRPLNTSLPSLAQRSAFPKGAARRTWWSQWLPRVGKRSSFPAERLHNWESRLALRATRPRILQIRDTRQLDTQETGRDEGYSICGSNVCNNFSIFWFSNILLFLGLNHFGEILRAIYAFIGKWLWILFTKKCKLNRSPSLTRSLTWRMMSK